MQSLNLEDGINAIAKFPEERNCRTVSHELVFLEQRLELHSAKDFYSHFGDLDCGIYELLKFGDALKMSQG